MLAITWSIEALDDLDRLDQFLRAKNAPAATRAVLAILEGVAMLSESPEAGRLMEGIGVEFRKLLVRFGTGGYVVYYHLSGDALHILAVRHGREREYPGPSEA